MTVYLQVKRPERVHNSSNFVIGISCVRRQNDVIYIVNTVKSSLSNLTRNQKKEVLIVLFIAEPSNHTFALHIIQMITSKFPDAVDSGFIEFINPQPEIYPDLTNLKSSYGDSKKRIMWRTKEVLDACIVMLYSLFRGKYFLFLEDDVVAKPEHFYQIQRFISFSKKDWVAARLAPYSKALLYKSEKLWKLWMIIDYLLLFHDDKPIDWLISDFFKQKTCQFSPKDCSNEFFVSYNRGLFQHFGSISSLAEKNV